MQNNINLSPGCSATGQHKCEACTSQFTLKEDLIVHQLLFHSFSSPKPSDNESTMINIQRRPMIPTENRNGNHTSLESTALTCSSHSTWSHQPRTYPSSRPVRNSNIPHSTPNFGYADRPLQTTVNLVHGSHGSGQYKCDRCGCHFQVREDLTVHQILYHNTTPSTQFHPRPAGNLSIPNNIENPPIPSRHVSAVSGLGYGDRNPYHYGPGFAHLQNNYFAKNNYGAEAGHMNLPVKDPNFSVMENNITMYGHGATNNPMSNHAKALNLTFAESNYSKDNHGFGRSNVNPLHGHGPGPGVTYPASYFSKGNDESERGDGRAAKEYGLTYLHVNITERVESATESNVNPVSESELPNKQRTFSARYDVSREKTQGSDRQIIGQNVHLHDQDDHTVPNQMNCLITNHSDNVVTTHTSHLMTNRVSGGNSVEITHENREKGPFRCTTELPQGNSNWGQSNHQNANNESGESNAMDTQNNTVNMPCRRTSMIPEGNPSWNRSNHMVVNQISTELNIGNNTQDNGGMLASRRTLIVPEKDTSWNQSSSIVVNKQSEDPNISIAQDTRGNKPTRTPVIPHKDTSWNQNSIAVNKESSYPSIDNLKVNRRNKPSNTTLGISRENANWNQKSYLGVNKKSADPSIRISQDNRVNKLSHTTLFVKGNTNSNNSGLIIDKESIKAHTSNVQKQQDNIGSKSLRNTVMLKENTIGSPSSCLNVDKELPKNSFSISRGTSSNKPSSTTDYSKKVDNVTDKKMSDHHQKSNPPQKLTTGGLKKFQITNSNKIKIQKIATEKEASVNLATGEGTGKHKCVRCGSGFHVKTDLDMHLLVFHSLHKPLKETIPKEPPKSESQKSMKRTVDDILRMLPNKRRTGGVKGEVRAVSVSYKCQTCDLSFLTLVGFEEHQFTDHKCRTCEFTFDNKEQLQRHKIIAHMCGTCGHYFQRNESRKMHPCQDNICTICGEHVESKEMLRDHVSEYHKCSGCRATFLYKVDLDKHRVNKHGHRCTICGYHFKWKDGLKQHMLATHGLKCVTCKARFTIKEDLEKHIMENHKCDICSLFFKTANTLQKHKNFIHICSVCGVIFKEREKLSEHQYKKHKCSLCNEQFKLQKELENHRRTIHKCCFCDVLFDSKIEQDLHPCETYKCPCGCNYETEDELELHSKENHFCPFCDTFFLMKVEFVNHRNTNHICRICGNEYILKADLDKHKETSHICKKCGANPDYDKKSYPNICTCGENFLCYTKKICEQSAVESVGPLEADNILDKPCIPTISNYFPAAALNIDEQKSNGISVSSCRHCHAPFTDAVIFKEHKNICTGSNRNLPSLKVFTELDGVFSCLLCQDQFVSKEAQAQHLRILHPRVTQCDDDLPKDRPTEEGPIISVKMRIKRMGRVMTDKLFHCRYCHRHFHNFPRFKRHTDRHKRRYKTVGSQALGVKISRRTSKVKLPTRKQVSIQE